jgi:hypothetical protein
MFVKKFTRQAIRLVEVSDSVGISHAAGVCASRCCDRNTDTKADEQQDEEHAEDERAFAARRFILACLAPRHGARWAVQGCVQDGFRLVVLLILHRRHGLHLYLRLTRRAGAGGGETRIGLHVLDDAFILLEALIARHWRACVLLAYDIAHFL